MRDNLSEVDKSPSHKELSLPKNNHTEPPNPHNTTGLPNAWGWLVILAVNAAVLAIIVIAVGVCQGCGSYTATQSGTLGGSYRSHVEQSPFSTTTTETVTAPSVEAVQSTMLSDAVRLCLAQRERQAELAVRRDASRATPQGGSVAVVPPQHPSSVTDDYAYCMSLAQGQTSGSALSQSTVPIPPTVVQNPWMSGYGQFSGTGGAMGVR